MAQELRTSIGLTGPFNTPEEEAFIGLVRTSWLLSSPVNAVYARARLTASQYNVLRILRGARGEALFCSDISSRMVTRDSDLTRILVGLQKRSLVERRRCSEDRRAIRNRITEEGLALLATLDKPVVEVIQGLLHHLGPKKLGQLSQLLEEARNP